MYLGGFGGGVVLGLSQLRLLLGDEQVLAVDRLFIQYSSPKLLSNELHGVVMSLSNDVNEASDEQVEEFVPSKSRRRSSDTSGEIGLGVEAVGLLPFANSVISSISSLPFTSPFVTRKYIFPAKDAQILSPGERSNALGEIFFLAEADRHFTVPVSKHRCGCMNIHMQLIGRFKILIKTTNRAPARRPFSQ